MLEKYNIEFIVKASSWDEVVQIFADELDIKKEKKNTSDRDISGLFMVRVLLDKDQLTQQFYEKVCTSSNLAIIDDKYSETFREIILKEVAIVEIHLRKLLLLVSDLVNDYYDHFLKTTLAKNIAQKNEVVVANDVNAITSYLTLDEILNILGSNVSTWDNKVLTANDLLRLLECGDLSMIKNKLEINMLTGIVWDSISKHILDDHTPWNDIKDDLYRLKEVRNKAAHFRVLTISDVAIAKSLSKSILTKTKKKQIISRADISSLRSETFKQFYDSLYSTQGMLSSISKMSTSAMTIGKALQLNIDAMQLARPGIAAAQAMAEALRPSIEAARVMSSLDYNKFFLDNLLSQLPEEIDRRSVDQQKNNSSVKDEEKDNDD